MENFERIIESSESKHDLKSGDRVTITFSVILVINAHSESAHTSWFAIYNKHDDLSCC